MKRRYGNSQNRPTTLNWNPISGKGSLHRDEHMRQTLTESWSSRLRLLGHLNTLWKDAHCKEVLTPLKLTHPCSCLYLNHLDLPRNEYYIFTHNTAEEQQTTIFLHTQFPPVGARMIYTWPYYQYYYSLNWHIQGLAFK